jgi:hypothetical protein
VTGALNEYNKNLLNYQFASSSYHMKSNPNVIINIVKYPPMVYTLSVISYTTFDDFFSAFSEAAKVNFVVITVS